jgi:hypothetical protein
MKNGFACACNRHPRSDLCANKSGEARLAPTGVVLQGATLVIARHHNAGRAQDPPLQESLFVGGDVHVYVAVREHAGRDTPASWHR